MISIKAHYKRPPPRMDRVSARVPNHGSNRLTLVGRNVDLPHEGGRGIQKSC
jgi:hypothetical protein